MPHRYKLSPIYKISISDLSPGATQNFLTAIHEKVLENKALETAFLKLHGAWHTCPFGPDKFPMFLQFDQAVNKPTYTVGFLMQVLSSFSLSGNSLQEAFPFFLLC